MAFPSYTVTNLSSLRAIALDVKFSEDRALRRTVPAGGSITFDNSLASPDELDRSPELRRLIDGGDISIRMAGGPSVALRYEVDADAGTDAAAVSLTSSFPFEIALTDVTLLVPTGVATSTLQLADAASAGNNYTGAEDTDGTPAAVTATLQATRVVPAGSSLFGLQSATAKPAVSVIVSGVRLTI